MTWKERRHNFRVKTERPVLCFQLDPEARLGEPVPAMTCDVSSRGICLRFDSAAYVGTRICVQLRFSDPRLDLFLPARKVRVGAADFGYRFEALTLPAQVELTRFVFAEAKRLNELARAVEAGADGEDTEPALAA